MRYSMPERSPVAIAAAALAFVAVAVTPGAAQSAGPLSLQPIASSIVFAPDVKVTSVNDKTGVLTGAYAGKLIEKRVLVGGAAYWLADPRDDARMFYGGLLLGARVLGGQRADVSTRLLAGFGEGTAYRTIDTAVFVPHRHGGRPLRWGGADGFVAGYRTQFGLVEPELRGELRLTQAFSVSLGAGYRVTSADGWLGKAFRGATGSLGAQFTFGR